MSARTVMNDTFDSADFYDARDQASVQYESPEEAIEDFLDFHWEKGQDIRDQIAEHCPIKVRALSWCTFDDGDAKACAERAADRFIDHCVENFGGGDDYDGLSPANRKELESRLHALFIEFGPKVERWRCEQVAERSYSASEVERMMCSHSPSWFEDLPERIVQVGDVHVFTPHSWGKCSHCQGEYEGAARTCGCGRTHCPHCGQPAEPAINGKGK